MVMRVPYGVSAEVLGGGWEGFGGLGGEGGLAMFLPRGCKAMFLPSYVCLW